MVQYLISSIPSLTHCHTREHIKSPFNSLCEIQVADNPAALGEKGAFNSLCEIQSNQKLITLRPEFLELA